MGFLQLVLLALWWVLTAGASPLSLATAPVVDLGYELHQATLNETGGYYNFSNIPYGASTEGDLRFAPPQPPPPLPPSRRRLNDGQSTAACPGLLTAWLGVATLFTAGLDYTQANASNSTSVADSRASEDCLLLDLVVPKAVFHGNLSAPVLVWIHGGGFASGNKSEQGNGAGLLARSMEQGNTGIIYVAINYRLGLFGWLAGTEFEKQSGTPNVGLLDQRLALEWVQKHIQRFGGDPGRVTVMAESAGAGSTVLHMAGVSAKRPAVFQQAILQSPWLLPPPRKAQQDALYSEVLRLANATTLSQLRRASTATLQAANSMLIARAPYGTFVFGPTVDHDLVRGSPTPPLASSSNKASSVRLIVGHNSDEGLLFTPPQAADEGSFESLLGQVLPAASPATLSLLDTQLYPATYNASGAGASSYASPLRRYAAAYAEVAVLCTARRLAAGRQHAYVFSVPPGLHALDLTYTFFAGVDDGTPAAALAAAMQRYFANFAASGSPAAGPLRVPAPFPRFDAAGTAAPVLLNFSTAALGVVPDDVDAERCRRWIDLSAGLW